MCASSRGCTQTLPQGFRLAIISTYRGEPDDGSAETEQK